MDQYPDLVSELLSRYKGRPVIHIIQDVDASAKRTEISYGSLMVPIDGNKQLVLITHTYELIGIKATDWTIPGGKLEVAETFEECAIRETVEETGMVCEVIDLYKVFHYTHRYKNEKIAEWYMPAFIGVIRKEKEDYNEREIQEVKRFTEPPKGFAGELNQYYADLMQFINSINCCTSP